MRRSRFTKSICRDLTRKIAFGGSFFRRHVGHLKHKQWRVYALPETISQEYFRQNPL